MHFPLSSCQNLPPTYSMVHLLHRSYGVDALGYCLVFCLYSCCLLFDKSSIEYVRSIAHINVIQCRWELQSIKIA